MTKCQISYLPIASQNASEEVKQAADIISRFDLEVREDEMSTTLRGELSDILKAIDAVYTGMDSADKQFRLNVDLLSSKAYS